jgi:hypothetical protein
MRIGASGVDIVGFPIRTDDDDAAHRFTVQGEGDHSVGDQIGLTAAVLLLLVGQLLELVPGPIEADPVRDHAAAATDRGSSQPSLL